MVFSCSHIYGRACCQQNVGPVQIQARQPENNKSVQLLVTDPVNIMPAAEEQVKCDSAVGSAVVSPCLSKMA